MLKILGLDIRRYRTWSNPPSQIQYSTIHSYATYAPWLNDKAFLSIYQKIKSNTLVDIYRCYELWSLAKQVRNLDGDILEIGVWRGGTGSILAEAVKDTPKTVFLADTFTGVVKAGVNDPIYKGGEHADTSLEIVKKLINSLELTNVILLQGIFSEDTADKVSEKIALLHIDVDVYQSSKDIVEWCLPRLAMGGVIIFDDCGFSGCEGVAAYCEELQKNPYLRFIYNLNGHAIFTNLR